jgi:tetratricopeptide (TPR) repeat protein
MRALVGLAVACLLAGAAHAAPAEPLPVNPPAQMPGAPAAPDPAALDALFERLKVTGDATEARGIEAEIWRRWLDSGDAEVNRLMSWTIAAMNARAYALALQYLNTIVLTKPDFPEGWNKRATLYWLAGDYERSLADIERTLALEPRHWGALAGRGMILRDRGEYKQAVAAFRAALEIDPNLEDVRVGLRVLEDRLGKDI